MMALISIFMILTAMSSVTFAGVTIVSTTKLCLCCVCDRRVRDLQVCGGWASEFKVLRFGGFGHRVL